MGKYEEMTVLFASHEDKENAVSMKKYMKNQFEFFGLATPERKALYKDFMIRGSKALFKISRWQFAQNHCRSRLRTQDFLSIFWRFSM